MAQGSSVGNGMLTSHILSLDLREVEAMIQQERREGEFLAYIWSPTVPFRSSKGEVEWVGWLCGS
jgi:hypothetical protein